MKKIFLLACLGTITTFTSAKNNESAFAKEAMTVIKNQMKDPDSAQFRNLREIKNTANLAVVCGEINAKNSYGGYVGYTPFSYSKEGVGIISNNNRGYESLLNLSNFNQSGCAGEKAEISARNPQMFTNYCEVAYQLFPDVIADKIPRETAIDRAMITYKDKKLEVFNNNLEKAKADLLTNLDQVLASPPAVKSIAKNRDSFKKQYTYQCSNMMKTSFLNDIK